MAIARRCEGLVLAARGDLDRAIDALDIALAEHARRCLPLELGRTLLEKGSVGISRPHECEEIVAMSGWQVVVPSRYFGIG